jgi:MoaA/NifB/PqqE/SkfB family radical SAM enzyme
MKDLSNYLTVFVIDAGVNPNITSCLNALKNQNIKFTLDIIKDYAPMSVAFQQMLLRVKTPYYIEVDNDMILHYNAIEIMYQGITQTNEKNCMDCYMLKDVHLQKDIFGVKIYKSEIFKKYNYDISHPSCEMEQLQRLQKDGYGYRTIKEIVGEHSPNWNSELIFERYFNLMEKFKIFQYEWMKDIPKILVEKIKKDPSDLNIYALLGAASSIYSEKVIDEEKNIFIKRKNYGKIFSYLNPPTLCTLYMTDKCNYKCTFCNRQYDNISSSKDMNEEIVNIVLNKFPTVNGFCMCGFGSPFLNKDIFKIINLLKSKNKYVGIITNGSLIKSKIEEIKKNPPNYISISLNAHTQEEHENVTKTKTWNDVLEGISLLLKLKIPVYVSHVVTTANINKIPEFLKFVKSLGVTTVHLHNLLPHSDDETFWKLVLQKEHESVLESYKQLPEADIVQKWPTLIDKSGGKQACGFPWYSFGVDGNGDLSICNSVLPTNKEIFGNIKEDIVWNSKKLQDFREKFCENKLEKCKLCFRNWYFQ